MKNTITIFFVALILSISVKTNAQWTDCSLGILNPAVNGIAKSGQYLFIGTDNRGVYRSSNDGFDWEYKSAGMGPRDVHSFYADGPEIYAGTISKGIYYSSDYGDSWIERGFNTIGAHVYAIGKSGQNIIISDAHYSSNKGITWNPCNFPSVVTIDCFANLGDTIFAVAGNIYSSVDNGVSWTLNDSIPHKSNVYILSTNGELYTGSSNGVYKSTNRGNSWYAFNQGLPLPVNYVYALENHNGILFATYNPTIYFYSTSNMQWTPTEYYFGSYNIFNGLQSFGNKLFAIQDYSKKGLYYTSNNGTNWSKTKVVNHTIKFLYNYNGKLFACSDSSGAYFSTNNGDLWNPIINNNICFTVVTNINSNIFLASADSGVFKSTNEGLNWVKCNNGLSNLNILALNKKDSTIYAGTSNGLYYSDNLGSNWIPFGFNSKRISAICAIDNLLLIGTNSGLYVSTNNGYNWSTEHISGKIINVIKNYYNFIYAGTNDGSYCSGNNGISWTNIGLNSTVSTDVIRYADSALFIATKSGLYRSYNNGQTWKLLHYNSYSFLDFNDYLYLGGGNGILKAPKNNLLTKINDLSGVLLANFSLSQNFPNPFNPSTSIRYAIPRESDVKLVVYDVMGREIATLVNERLNAGTYTVDWNASEFPSGVYFYRLTADNFTETKKLLLIK